MDIPGIYEVVSDVSIRREPRIVEYTDPKTKKTTTNAVGLLNTGTQRAIYSILVQSDNTTWGRLSAADSAGIAEWACIQGINRTFMKFIEPLNNQPVQLGGLYTIEYVDASTVRLTPKTV